MLFFTSLRKNKLFNLSIFSWPVSKKRFFSIYSWIVDTVESHLVPEWQLTALHIELFGMWGHIKSLILQERPFCLIQNNVHQLSSKFLQKLVSINYRLVLKVAFFQKVQIVFHISQKIFQISISNYPEFEIWKCIIMNYYKMGTFLIVPSANKANHLSNSLKITI